MNATATASKLDMDKFAKVHRLMSEGATDGERAAARARAEAMASRAGMTLKQATSKMGAKPKAQPAAAQTSSGDWRDIFRGMDDWMEEREPGYKAKQAEQAARKEAERNIEVARIMCHYGSKDALFADTERERRLREGLEPLADRKKFSNSDSTYIAGYAGWTCREPTPPLWEALARAYPLPTTLEQAWTEYCEWETLGDDRATVDRHYDTPVYVQARMAGLEHMLDTMSDPSISGFRARFGWLRHIAFRDCARDPGEDRALAGSLERDFAKLVAQGDLHHRKGGGDDASPAPPADLRRTNADKQRDVLSILDSEPGLSNREIARRCGVSPQTVGNWRSKRAAA